MTRLFELDDLYALQVPSDPQLSPDEEAVAFVVTTADRDSDQRLSTIWWVPVSGGPAHRLTADTQDSTPRFAPAGDTIVFLRPDADGVAQLWSVPVAGGDEVQLTSLPLGAGAPVWNRDGSALAFSAFVDTEPPALGPGADKRPVVIDDLGYKLDGFGLRREIREHIFVLPWNGGGLRQISSGDSDHSGTVWSPDGRHIAFSTPDYRTHGTVLCPQRVGVIDIEGGQEELLTAADAMLTPLDWSDDGQSLLLVGSDQAGLAEPRLWTVPARGGQLHELLDDQPGHFMPGWDMNVSARFSRDSQRVLIGEWRHALTRLLQVPVAGGDPEELVGGDQNVRAASFGENRIAYVAGDASHIGELYIRDGDGNRRLTSLQAGALPDVGFTAPQVRVFESTDGTPIHGYVLRREDATGPGPVLLDIHGGPYNAWTPTLSEHFLHQQVLAARGWTVLCVDPRGSASYGDQFMQATTGSWGFADEGDLLGAVDTLVREGIADPARLAVSGFSYGGYMAAWLTARTKRFAAAVCGVMVCDEVAAQGSDAGPLGSYLVAGGPLWEAFDRLVECSPISHVGNVTTPTLILQGEDDLRTPMGQAEQWFQALRSRNVRVQLVRYPKASHYFLLEGTPFQAFDAYRRLIDWVVEHTGAAVADQAHQ